MTIANVLDGLKASLLTVVPGGGYPGLTAAQVLVDPPENISAGDFPLAVLYLTPGVENEFKINSEGAGYEHIYHVTMFIFLSVRTSGLADDHRRVINWPIPVYLALLNNMTLSGQCEYIGHKQGDLHLLDRPVWSVMQWGGGEYIGWKFPIWVTELYAVAPR